MTTQKNKIQILTNALSMREEEIFNYQIDIENFKRAIKKTEIEYKDNPEIQEFKAHLENLLKENCLQQTKSRIIRDVIKEQLFELTGDLCFTSN
jgi:hypothetical protein